MIKPILTYAFLTYVCLTSYSQTTFGPKQTINSNTTNDPYAIASGLIDDDAYVDIITATTITNRLVWYKNNGDGTFTQQPNIANTINYVGTINLVDLNDDTYLDLLVTAYYSNSVTWYANDGDGNFGAEQLIGTLNGASGLATGDINGDSTIDVVATSYDNNTVSWFSNDGSGSFTGPNILDNTLNGPGTVNLSDIDNDGDLDALVSTAMGYGSIDLIQVFKNDLIPGGSAVYSKETTPVTTGKNYFANAIFADVDGDGDFDVLATELNTTPGTGHFYWYENTGTEYTQHSITTSVGNPSTVLFEDLDLDGLKDIVLSSGSPGSGNDIVWFKNIGSGVFDPELVIDATQSNTFVMTTADFDNDTDLDIASLSYNQDDLNWFENLLDTLGTPTNVLANVVFYPNPAIDRLYIKGLNSEDTAVSVYDILGHRVISSSLNFEESLDVSQLSSGTYILKLENNDSNFKFIKR